MLEAFRMKPFDLEPVYAEWTDGPIFKGNPKKDLPIEEWLEKIKAGCVARNVPEEYWYKVAQHFMGPKAKARFDEVKQVVAKVNGGKYRWTWKKFKVAMTNMGWDIDPNTKETIKVRGGSSGLWFMRKKSEKDETEAPKEKEAAAGPSKRPSRSNTMRFTKKPLTEEPEGEPSRPVPTRSKTMAESSFWPVRHETKDDKDKKEARPSRPTHQKAKSETSVVGRDRSASGSEPPRSQTTDGNEAVTTVTQAPVWLLNACTALDFLTNEHPKTMSVISAILITVGSIPAIPAISAGAGGAILASGAAHAIGAIAVGLGQALGSTVKNAQSQQHAPAASS